MYEFIKYPSTPAFKDVRVQVHRLFKPKFVGLMEDNTPLFEEPKIPPVWLYGSVKVHGTHQDVCLSEDGEVYTQSRNRVITSPLDDNFGFYSFVKGNEQHFKEALLRLKEQGKQPVINGEWAGGNIQAGVGVSGMPKSFFIFNEGVNVAANNVYNIHDIYSFVFKADFNKPDELFAQLMGYTLMVEAECPVAKELNPDKQGELIGEGIVWKFTLNDTEFIFKTKGEKHARGGGVKVPQQPRSQISSPELDKLISDSVTVDRLEQGKEFLVEMGLPVTNQSTGAYLRWVLMDISKEFALEIGDLAKHGVEWKVHIAPTITQMAKAYYLTPTG